MARNTRTFVDLDFNFKPHPATKDVGMRYDESAIKQSIRNLILTKPYERPFRSYLSSPVMTLMFENITPMTTSLLKRTITDTITNHEPRVDVLNVEVSYTPDQNAVHANVEFRIKNTQTPLSVNLLLERTR